MIYREVDHIGREIASKVRGAYCGGRAVDILLQGPLPNQRIVLGTFDDLPGSSYYVFYHGCYTQWSPLILADDSPSHTKSVTNPA